MDLTLSPTSAPNFLMLFLPDNEMLNLTFSENQRILSTHESGRPWLVGDSSETPMVGLVHGALVAVVGQCPMTATSFNDKLTSLSKNDDTATLLSELPGSFILAVSHDGALRLAGDRAGLHRVFHAYRDNQVIASNSIADLRRVIKTSIDRQILAARLTVGRLPPPLSERSGWNEIKDVEPGQMLRIFENKTTNSRIPFPHNSWHSGERQAEIIKDYLSNSLLPDITSAQQIVSSDLSGGLDSTSLAFFASLNKNITTFRWAELEAGNDDAQYAQKAIEELEGNHLAINQRDLALPFDEPSRVLPSDHQPYQFARTSARIRQSIDTIQSHGVARHFSGHGADEIFNAPPGYLKRLFKKDPMRAVQNARQLQVLHRWKNRQLLEGMARPQSLRSWWLQQAKFLDRPPERGRTPAFSWGMSPVRACRWATQSAIEVTRNLLLDTANSDRALSTDIAEHQVVMSARTNAPGFRHLIQSYKQQNIDLRLPYLDNQVIEAVLALDARSAIDPYRYKPILADAGHGIVPGFIRNRRTKGEFSKETLRGYRANRGKLQEIFRESALAETQYVDVDRLSRSLGTPDPDLEILKQVEYFIGCEMWYRKVLSGDFDGPS